jgi:hypothetical protein
MVSTPDPFLKNCSQSSGQTAWFSAIHASNASASEKGTMRAGSGMTGAMSENSAERAFAGLPDIAASLRRAHAQKSRALRRGCFVDFLERRWWSQAGKIIARQFRLEHQ